MVAVAKRRWQLLVLATRARRELPHRLLLQRPPDRILASAISRGMSEHFRNGIQMTDEVARGALPSEFLIEGPDELPYGQLSSALQH